MSVRIFQVPKEVYDKFTGYLKYTQISFFRVKDFTPKGQWCLIKAVGVADELEDANNFLDQLISRI